MIQVMSVKSTSHAHMLKADNTEHPAFPQTEPDFAVNTE